MKKILLPLFFYLSATISLGQLITTPQTLISNQAYVVHSGMKMGSQLNNTSNIYVIKGMADSVWIFGSGYGDSTTITETSDIKIYKGNAFEPTRNAIDDASEVNAIITNSFGIPASSAKLMFIVPHYHLDHINKEFIDAFFISFPYSPSQTRVYVHINDSVGSICNSKCCGGVVCNNLSDPFFGVPFRKAWTQSIINKFDAIGAANDTCNQEILKFNAPSGIWKITKALAVVNNGHTDGSVNMQNTNYQYKINGADGGNQCYLPAGWIQFPIHGNIPLITALLATSSDIPELNIYPNPSSGPQTLSFTLLETTRITVKLYGILGNETILANSILLSAGKHDVFINSTELVSGLYICKMNSEKFSISKLFQVIK